MPIDDNTPGAERLRAFTDRRRNEMTDKLLSPWPEVSRNVARTARDAKAGERAARHVLANLEEMKWDELDAARDVSLMQVLRKFGHTNMGHSSQFTPEALAPDAREQLEAGLLLLRSHYKVQTFARAAKRIAREVDLVKQRQSATAFRGDDIASKITAAPALKLVEAVQVVCDMHETISTMIDDQTTRIIHRYLPIHRNRHKAMCSSKCICENRNLHFDVDVTTLMLSVETIDFIESIAYLLEDLLHTNDALRKPERLAECRLMQDGHETQYPPGDSDDDKQGNAETATDTKAPFRTESQDAAGERSVEGNEDRRP